MDPTAVKILNTLTAADGTSWTALASNPCRAVRCHNPSATVYIDVRRGTGSEITVPPGQFRDFFAVADSSQLQIRRTDTNVAQVTLQAEIWS